jgi:hypothetical protein
MGHVDSVSITVVEYFVLRYKRLSKKQQQIFSGMGLRPSKDVDALKEVTLKQAVALLEVSGHRDLHLHPQIAKRLKDSSKELQSLLMRRRTRSLTPQDFHEALDRAGNALEDFARVVNRGHFPSVTTRVLALTESFPNAGDSV